MLRRFSSHCRLSPWKQGCRRWKRAVTAVAACVTSVLVVSACGDAEGDPLALALGSESRGAFLLDQGLPTVPRLLEIHGLASEADVEGGVWLDSWNRDRPEGEEVRQQIRASVVPRLLQILGDAGVEDMLSQLSSSLVAAEALVSAIEFRDISGSLAKARDLHRAARSALENGDSKTGLLLALQCSDALWELSPRQVASGLMRTASEALGRKPGRETYSEQELTRIRRLMYGALEAFDEKDYPRAIRRAYYACQLLGAGTS